MGMRFLLAPGWCGDKGKAVVDRLGRKIRMCVSGVQIEAAVFCFIPGRRQIGSRFIKPLSHAQDTHAQGQQLVVVVVVVEPDLL